MYLAVNNRKENALIRASLFGDTATVSLLLSKGLDINAFTLDSTTALINAVLNANKPVIFQLLERGADPDKLSFFGLTSLSFAVIFTDAESVKAILKKTKKVNAMDVGGNTVLMYAGYNEHDDVEMIQALLDKGADVNIKAKDGATALSWAFEKRKYSNSCIIKKSRGKIIFIKKSFMKKWLVLSAIVIVIASFTTVTNKKENNDPEAIKKAINKSLPLLQTTSHAFLENAGGCQSCHHQDLTAVSLSLAKEKGFQINEAGLNEIFDSISK